MDLWAENGKNNLALATTAEQERMRVGRGLRRPIEHEVFSLIRNLLLQQYVPAYCVALGASRLFRRCYWIDALGVDAKSVKANLSSALSSTDNDPQRRPTLLEPLLALSQLLVQENGPFAFNGLILAAGRRKRGAASKGETSFALPPGSGLLSAHWLEVAPLLLGALDQIPTVFLLNPLGTTMFSYEDLLPLYQRTIPTELCLLLPHKQILTRLRAEQPSSALTSLLRSDRWKVLPTTVGAEAQAISGFIALFSTSMQRHFQLPVQSINLSVINGPAHLEPLPYTLIFATRRFDSLAIMNDLLCNYQRQLEMQSYRGTLSETWFIAQQRARSDASLQQLAHNILQIGRAQRVRRWPDLRQQLVFSQFGRFTLYDYDMLMRQLLLSRDVSCTWQKISTDSAEERIPGSNDTLQWH